MKCVGITDVLLAIMIFIAVTWTITVNGTIFIELLFLSILLSLSSAKLFASDFEVFYFVHLLFLSSDYRNIVIKKRKKTRFVTKAWNVRPENTSSTTSLRTFIYLLLI